MPPARKTYNFQYRIFAAAETPRTEAWGLQGAAAAKLERKVQPPPPRQLPWSQAVPPLAAPFAKGHAPAMGAPPQLPTRRRCWGSPPVDAPREERSSLPPQMPPWPRQCWELQLLRSLSGTFWGPSRPRHGLIDGPRPPAPSVSPASHPHFMSRHSHEREPQLNESSCILTFHRSISRASNFRTRQLHEGQRHLYPLPQLPHRLVDPSQQPPPGARRWGRLAPLALGSRTGGGRADNSPRCPRRAPHRPVAVMTHAAPAPPAAPRRPP